MIGRVKPSAKGRFLSSQKPGLRWYSKPTLGVYLVIIQGPDPRISCLGSKPDSRSFGKSRTLLLAKAAGNDAAGYESLKTTVRGSVAVTLITGAALLTSLESC